MPETRHGVIWSRDELILAFDLYCRLPFGRLNKSTPEIIALAEALGRSPSSVSMKCCNFAAFDPALRERGVGGLANASKGDREIWDEFQADWNGLSLKAWELRASRQPSVVDGEFSVDDGQPQRADRLRGLSRLGGGMDEMDGMDGMDEVDARAFEQPSGPSEREAIIKARIHQTFFRSVILSSYENTCCITGLKIHEALVARRTDGLHLSRRAGRRARRVVSGRRTFSLSPKKSPQG